MNVPAPDRGSPYPPDTEPLPSQEIEFVPVEFVDSTIERTLNPIVAGIAIGVAGNLVYDGGKWIISKAWDIGTKKPVNDFKLPPTVYSAQTGLVYQRYGDGYVPVGPAVMR